VVAETGTGGVPGGVTVPSTSSGPLLWSAAAGRRAEPASDRPAALAGGPGDADAAATPPCRAPAQDHSSPAPRARTTTTAAKAGGPAPGVGTQIPPQEPGRAELAPLPHMDELVGQQRVVAGVVAAEEDHPPQGHGRHARREPGHVDDPGPGDVGRRHQREVALDAPHR